MKDGSNNEAEQVNKDYYARLGVNRDASPDELKAAFRTEARKTHPDVNKAPDAEERFKELNEAYAVLSDAEERATYDRLGHEQYVSGQTDGSSTEHKQAMHDAWTEFVRAGIFGFQGTGAEAGNVFFGGMTRADIFGGEQINRTAGRKTKEPPVEKPAEETAADPRQVIRTEIRNEAVVSSGEIQGERLARLLLEPEEVEQTKRDLALILAAQKRSEGWLAFRTPEIRRRAQLEHLVDGITPVDFSGYREKIISELKKRGMTDREAEEQYGRLDRRFTEIGIANQAKRGWWHLIPADDISERERGDFAAGLETGWKKMEEKYTAK